VEKWMRVDPALHYLSKGSFRVITYAHLTEIRSGEAMVRPLQSDKAERISAGLVVMVSPREPLAELYGELLGKVPVLHIVGDARTPRDLQAAVREGHIAGRFIAGDAEKAAVPQELHLLA
jgi:hypothetical protein